MYLRVAHAATLLKKASLLVSGLSRGGNMITRTGSDVESCHQLEPQGASPGAKALACAQPRSQWNNHAFLTSLLIRHPSINCSWCFCNYSNKIITQSQWFLGEKKHAVFANLPKFCLYHCVGFSYKGENRDERWSMRTFQFCRQGGEGAKTRSHQYTESTTFLCPLGSVTFH